MWVPRRTLTQSCPRSSHPARSPQHAWQREPRRICRSRLSVYVHSTHPPPPSPSSRGSEESSVYMPPPPFPLTLSHSHMLPSLCSSSGTHVNPIATPPAHRGWPLAGLVCSVLVRQVSGQLVRCPTATPLLQGRVARPPHAPRQTHTAICWLT